MLNEAAIRDHLAENLGILEHGLQLVAKEYRLKNPGGSSGRIDILAKDRFGNFLVVELKRSDAAARTAIHEILKYLALLKSEKGVPSSKIRCLVVSTDWSELRAPFSELVHTSPFTIEGRLLRLDEQGVPSAVTPVAPSALSDGLRFPDYINWMVCASQEEQKSLADRLIQLLPGIGVRNTLLVLMTSKKPDEVMFPFSVAMPLFPLSLQEARQVHGQSHWPVRLLDDFAGVTVNDDEYPTAVYTSLESQIFCLPEVRDVHHTALSSFHAEREWWTVDAILRDGPQVADREILTDDDILAAMRGTDGSSGMHMVRAVEAGHKQQFYEFQELLRPMLEAYGWWEVAKEFMERASKEPETTLVVDSYCPDRFLVHFGLFLRTGDPRWLPAFRLLACSPSSVDAVSGAMAWDGTTTGVGVDDLLSKISGINVLRLSLPDADADMELVKKLGLAFPVRQFSKRGVDDKLPLVRMTEWRDRNRQLVVDLHDRLPIGSLPSAYD